MKPVSSKATLTERIQRAEKAGYGRVTPDVLLQVLLSRSSPPPKRYWEVHRGLKTVTAGSSYNWLAMEQRQVHGHI